MPKSHGGVSGGGAFASARYGSAMDREDSPVGGGSASVAPDIDDRHIMFGSRHLSLAYNFWKDKVAKLERPQQKILGLLLFSNLFKKSKEARELFTTTDITKQALRLLDMFGWLLRTLDSRDAMMRARTLSDLGDRHVVYGVQAKFFKPMFEALDLGLREMFEEEYTDEIADAVKSLFTKAGEEMMIAAGGTDAEDETPSVRWLVSIEFALADPMGFSALTQYLHHVKLGEFAEFHRAYQIYRSTMDDEVRKQVGGEIFRVFFASEAALPIKGFPRTRDLRLSIDRAFSSDREVLALDVFDPAHKFVKRQMVEHAWTGFREAHKDFGKS
jgi:hemoglobin-like flavoprotein